MHFAFGGISPELRSMVQMCGQEAVLSCSQQSIREAHIGDGGGTGSCFCSYSQVVISRRVLAARRFGHDVSFWIFSWRVFASRRLQ